MNVEQSKTDRGDAESAKVGGEDGPVYFAEFDRLLSHLSPSSKLAAMKVSAIFRDSCLMMFSTLRLFNSELEADRIIEGAAAIVLKSCTMEREKCEARS
jgi:hypothetical protein